MIFLKLILLFSKQEKKKSFQHIPATEDPALLALSLYTSDEFFPTVNEGLRGRNAEVLLKYHQFVWSFVRGFRMLPTYWGKVYRGINVQDTSCFVPNQTIIFEGVTSCSIDKDSALNFLSNDPMKKHVLFEIESKSGRSLKIVSFYPEEEEIVFRPFTSFEVVKVANKKNYTCVHLKELYPDTRGRKVVLWVDDDPSSIKKIVEMAECHGVTVVHMESTLSALKFISLQTHLLQRPLDRFRILTDMARRERIEAKDGKLTEQPVLVKDAGLQLVEGLKK